MPAYKDNRQGTWYASFYFENWQGVKQKKLKRGFATKKDALAWEREFLLQQAADLTMTFEAFVEIYITDKKKRLRENTWFTKEHIIRTKILPYFKEKRLSEIKPRDVIAWQNEMLNYRDKNGKAYSPTYLKTLHGQLSAILNHAVRFYGLKSNAAATAGCMGSEKHKEMLFWTKEEYLKFAEVMMDKPQSYYAFEVLYWCGIREGELLALTPADFDLDKGLRHPGGRAAGSDSSRLRLGQGAALHHQILSKAERPGCDHRPENTQERPCHPDAAVSDGRDQRLSEIPLQSPARPADL